ncbi:MAG: SOS response-associated peptidase [Bacillota bacterium]|jgi:putative SOS response-associated peptidase YedK
MCFFYALSQTARSLQNRYNLKFEFELEYPAELTETPRYYAAGFDFPQMPVITNEQPDQLQYYYWGLIPAWVKTAEEARKMRGYTLNARSDTVFIKPAFRQAVRRRRCLIPTEGFYEWRLFAGRKYPYYIYLKNQAVFSLAGIWEQWTDRATGETVNTYSILTTEANALLAQIHNTKKRMPVVLPPDQERRWLQEDLDTAAIAVLLRPLEAGLLAAHTISGLITSRAANRNVAALRNPYQYAGLPGLE